MSNQQVRVASLLLQESFGDLVETVGSYLLKHGVTPMTDIIKNTGLKRNQVRKSLCVLIQHQLIKWHHYRGVNKRYTFAVDSMLLRPRFPRYIHTAKMLHGDAGELIIEDLLQHGMSLMSQCLCRVSERLEEAGVQNARMEDIVQEQFLALAEGHYVQRVEPPNTELVTISYLDQRARGGSTVRVRQRFELPPAVTEAMAASSQKRKKTENGAKGEEPSAKRTRGSSETVEETVGEEEMAADSGFLWYVNFDQFHQHFRNQGIVSAVAEKMDESAACVMRTILSHSTNLQEEKSLCSASSSQLFLPQITESLPERPHVTNEELEQYLKVLVDDEPQFLRKVGVSGGGTYSVDFRHTAELLCKATIESIVRERFGSKCFRIFRLLLLKKILEQKQVADHAMIPSREAKELLYILLAENFVTLQEIPRTPDYAPSRTFYLFSVNLPYVSRMVLERCYKALGNLLARRIAETKENKRLLEKFQQYERQQGLPSVDGEEVEEVLTPDERERVERAKRSITKLEQGELQLDETISTISSYIELHSSQDQ